LIAEFDRPHHSQIQVFQQFHTLSQQVINSLKPVRNRTPAPLGARTDGAAVAVGDLLLTGQVSALCSAGISNELERIRSGSREKSEEKEIASVLKAILPCVSFSI